MSNNAFESRRIAFEEEYFEKKEAVLVDKLKAVFHKKMDKEAIRQATGITDDGVLDNMVALNLSGEMMSAFKLLPLIEVAWADGDVDEREAVAVLKAAEKRGVAPGSAAHSMLERSLRNRPSPDSRKVWFLYADELRKLLNPKELETFRTDLLEVARCIAATSGGILNLAFTVSPNEKRVLEAVERALTPGGA